MIDTHCHLVSPQLATRFGEVLVNAHDAGVHGMITVATSSDDCRAGLELAREHPGIWCTAGIHPHAASEEPDWDTVLDVAKDDHCVAWGELGLDWYYKDPPREAQLKLLEDHIAVIERASGNGLDMPIVLHCREAYDDLLAILGSSSIDPARCVFHCYTADAATARTVIDFGAWVSFTGILTFKNAMDIQEAAKLVPDDRLMIETDSPYLSPEPMRTMRPNEPCNVVHVCRFLAKLRDRDPSEFEAMMDANAVRFYGLEN